VSTPTATTVRNPEEQVVIALSTAVLSGFAGSRFTTPAISFFPVMAI
jgi:hypothetical protein